jgi:hypothetical protein
VPEEPTAVIEINTNWTINSTDDEFMQPSDEDAQGNILPYEEIKRKRMADVQRTPSKEDSKPAAIPEVKESPLSAEQPRNRLRKRYHESEKNQKHGQRLQQNSPLRDQYLLQQP